VEGAMRILRDLAEAERLSVLLVHHATRGDAGRARGSSVFDARLEMIAVAEAIDGGLVRLHTTKLRDHERGDVGRARIRPVELPFGRPVATLEWLSEDESASAANTEAASDRDLLVLAKIVSHAGISRRKLAELTGVPVGSLSKIYDRLQAAGWLDTSFKPTSEGISKCDLEGGYQGGFGPPPNPPPESGGF